MKSHVFEVGTITEKRTSQNFRLPRQNKGNRKSIFFFGDQDKTKEIASPFFSVTKTKQRKSQVHFFGRQDKTKGKRKSIFFRCQDKTNANRKSIFFSIAKTKQIEITSPFFSVAKTKQMDVVGWPPYGCPQQERPDSVLLLVPVWTLPLNVNSTHPFYGFLRWRFHDPCSPNAFPLKTM